MSAFSQIVLVGNQAGKLTLTGTMKAQEYVQLLRQKEMTVNPNAQRSLMPGKFKETTEDLIENDAVLKTPRMKEFLKFVGRVMDNVEHDNSNEGFFGAIQLVIPKKFTKARLEGVELQPPSEVSHVAMIRAAPMMGESVFHIADGQGRVVGFHSLERELVKKTVRLKDAIKKLEKKNDPATEEREELLQLEAALARVRRFLSSTDISFVCYAGKVSADSTIVGLAEDAEKRCYIEGNALNSMASKEDILKYEQFSPIVVDLQARRDEHEWMSDEYIEEDVKSISSSSSKLFTLSALVQAYSWGLVNDNKPLKNVDANLSAIVDKRKAFCHSFWSKITEIFEPVWLEDIGDPGDRVVYLKRSRQTERNVVFQAIFLQALGRLCYAMGVQADWDAASPLLMKLDQLSPRLIDYRAVTRAHVDGEGKTHVDDWNKIWTASMMKSSKDGYSFNNASENINATRHFLAEKIGLDDSSVNDETDVGMPEAA